jgi:hypothetical protein
MKKVVYVHRIVFEAVHGPIPRRKLVMHTCDNRGCINIDHLQLGTDLENALDKQRKGRGNQTRGEKNGKCTVPERLARHIRKLRRSGLSYPQIARRIGRRHSTVYWICNGRLA